MFILENSDFEIYTEYLRNKYKDESIQVMNEEMTNSNHTTIVVYKCNNSKKSGTGYVDEIPYNELYVIVRKLKIKRLKEKLCQ